MTGHRVLAFVAAAAALVVGLLVAPVQALPGDPPVTAISPAEGATLPIDPDGIPVVYGCPVYRSYDAGDGFVVYGGRPQYNVYFATSPALAADGRLDLANVVGIAGPDQVQDPDLGEFECRGWMYDSSAHPQDTPGTYYWQAFRICTGCPGGYETGPVQSFTLTNVGSAIELGLKAPTKVYRGYAAVASLVTTGVATGQTVAVQGQVAGAWKTLGQGTVTADQAVVPFKAPKGTTSLRATYGSGTEQVTSAARDVAVLKPTTWPKAKRWAGAWKGSVAGSAKAAKFKVEGAPPLLKRGSFRMNLLCPTPGGPSPTTIQAATALVPKAKIAPDGTFVASIAEQGSAILLWGKLGSDTAKATVVMSLGTCTGRAAVKATHS